MFTSDLQPTIKAFIRRGETRYVAECLEVAVVTQGKTLDETIANLQEAVVLHLEGEDPAFTASERKSIAWQDSAA